ncbi:MAG: hypothetical protein IJG13_00725 [Kiritimatiellae bacterium]|nr:hypothetical protein [Kiritimatiellia bacterium]
MSRLFASLAAATAVGLINHASAALDGTVLTVGPGETVSYDVSDASQASELASLTGIAFEDPAGVVALSGAAAATLNANVTGRGKVTATGLASLTITGDSRGFTGGWDISNSPLVVVSRYGLGDGGTVGGTVSGGVSFGAYIHDSAATYPVTFRGNGLTNDVSVFIYNLTAAAVKINFDEPGTWMQNGRVKLQSVSKPYFGNVVFNAELLSASQCYIYAKRGSAVTFNGTSSFKATWWYSDSNADGTLPVDLHFNMTATVLGEQNFNKNTRVHCGDVGVFSAGNNPLYLESAGYMDLGGRDQTVWMLSRKSQSATTSANTTTETVTSAVPATIAITGGAGTRPYYSAAKYLGAASLVYRGTANPFCLVTGKSTTRGFLRVESGTFNLDWGAQWAGTNVTVTGGNLILNSLNSLKDDTADLVVTGGRLTIGPGVTAFVSRAKIGGASIADGVYTTAELVAAYPAADGLVDGDGSLAVGQNKPEVETVYDTWTGAAAPDTSLSADGNWKDGTAPDLAEGGADLTFTEGTNMATVDGDAAAVGLHFNLSESFTLAGAANATLTLGAGGISVTNVSGDASVVVTNTVLADIQNSLTAPGGVSVGPNAVLVLKGRYTGGSGTAPITATGRGEIVLEGDNSALDSELNLMVDGNKDTPFVVRIRSATALGSPARTTTISSPCIRFECPTNSTPVCMKGYGMVNSAYDGHNSIKRVIDDGRTLVMEGLMSSYGNICGYWRMDGVTLRGGFLNNGGEMAFFVSPGAAMHIESAVDTQPGTKQYPLRLFGGGSVHMSAAAHRYFRIHLKKHNANDTRLVCEEDGTLLPGFPVLFGDSAAPSGLLDLNGNDQEVSFLSHQMRSDNYETYYGPVASGAAFGVVTSAEAATLTLNGTLTGDQCDNKARYVCSPTNAVVKFTGLAGLHFAGATASDVQVLSFVQSDSQGTLRVSSGTLSFDRGAGWSGAREVLVDGTGVLKTDAASAPVLFGGAAGLSLAKLRIGGSGSLSIPSGAQVTVGTLKLGDSDGAGFMPSGVYGGQESGLDAAHTLPCLTGGGTLRVRKSGDGLLLFFM